VSEREPGPAVEPRLADLVARLASEGRLVAVRRAGRPLEAASLAGIRLAAIADDSRTVVPGAAFVAVPGLRTDGHAFLGDAVASGAAAVLVERAADPAPPASVVEVVVDRSSLALAAAASWWYGDPSQSLAVVGVTGTNGKTTTTYLAAAGLAGAGRLAGLVTTVGARIGGDAEPNVRPVTTPGALELQALLRRMVLAGDDSAVIETSSHGLAADRVASVAYDAAT
jgi:UDP-N-acetylmuramoyl-L-alanyl-D-glutamate--2,6-diaminopimelate ligase